MDPTQRVVVLIDMDCFYCQVEEKLNPLLKDKPIAVVQYNAWRGGGIIAVNYPARDEGVTRHMRGHEAKKKCPSITLVQVPEVRGKADLTKYRDAGKEVADVLATFTPLLQRASVDEAYLDITELVEKKMSSVLETLSVDSLPNTFVVGSELQDFLHNVKVNKEFSVSNLKLAVGGLITEEIRREVFEKTGYRCSAGIAHNKILAKLVCSFHKPNKQTILPQDAIEKLFETTQIRKITGLGGKFGESLTEDFGIKFMSELAKIPEKELAQKYDEKSATWLSNLAKGVDTEPVTTKLVSKSIGCCKNFPSVTALTTAESVELWLSKLSEEMGERLEKDLKENNRKAKQVIVGFIHEINKKDVSSSRTQPLVSYDPKKICQTAFNVIKKFCLRSDGSFHIKFLSLNAGHFQDLTKVREITSFFQTGQIKKETKIGKNAEKEEEFHENEDESHDENIFCQATQELDEETDGLIFYDDSYRLKNDDPLQGPSNNGESSDSNENDLHHTSETETKSENLNQSSFFAKYFIKEKTEVPEESPKLPDDSNLEETQEPIEICPECQKIIPDSEMVSHQDYHFALKLSRSERVVLKPEGLPKSEDKGSQKRGRPKGVKRKVDNNSSLVSFFTKDEDIADAETCPECNKKVKSEEMSSHMDYHTAKKIHMEINSINTTKPPIKAPKLSTKSRNGKKPAPRSVVSFFRPG